MGRRQRGDAEKGLAGPREEKGLQRNENSRAAGNRGETGNRVRSGARSASEPVQQPGTGGSGKL